VTTVAAATRDEAAFEELYRAHVDEVYTLTLRMVGDVHIAEDITQEIFIRLWRKIETFQGRSSFRTWLYRLSLNVIFRQRARLRSRPHIPLHETEIADRDGAADVIIKADLQRAIVSVPLRSRAVLILHDLKQYKHREIADILGISAGTSKAHLYRARKLMRKELEQ